MRILAVVVLACATVAAQDGNPARSNDGALSIGEAAKDAVLATAATLDALTAETIVEVTPDQSLQVDPGIRLTKVEGGYSLATYDGKKVLIEAGTGKVALPSPVIARVTERGWELGAGKPFAIRKISARRQGQDDVDENLRKMQDAAKALKKPAPETGRKPQAGKTKLRVRWVYGENGMATAEILNSQAILQLKELSPSGFK